jgi:2-polyprenyl-3-methyl-5-hydroxy-6-metoxy-1,4-benzoquinol methylase
MTDLSDTGAPAAGAQAGYADKGEQYFANARTEILSWLPRPCGTVLELGCGNGATLKWLKAAGHCHTTCGIELFADAAKQAEQGVDCVLQGDIENIEPIWPAGHFDLILCLDVLEHLVDPWRVLQRLQTLLRPGGRLIASIPNVRNWHALGPLLLAGRWQYGETGILDKTHLRFFTHASSVQLVAGSGLQVVAVERLPLNQPGKSRLANRLTLGLLRDFLTLQFLIVADQSGGEVVGKGVSTPLSKPISKPNPKVAIEP